MKRVFLLGLLAGCGGAKDAPRAPVETATGTPDPATLVVADTVTVEKKLSRGKHTVAFRRATNTLSGPQFKVRLQGSSENVLFHSEQDLKIELVKPFRLPQGNTSTSVVVFRTPQASSE